MIIYKYDSDDYKSPVNKSEGGGGSTDIRNDIILNVFRPRRSFRLSAKACIGIKAQF